MNPIIYVDPDGRDIKLANYTRYSKDGTSYEGRSGSLSKTTTAALTDMLKTEEGMAYFSQFAKAGDKIGDYTFAKDGALSNVTLQINDYSLSEEKTVIPFGIDGKYTTDIGDGKKEVTIRIYSKGMDKQQAGETLSHEALLHGSGIKEELKTGKTTSAKTDHNALKNKNTKHEGYKRYNNIRNQLNKIDSKYEKAFKKAEKHAQDNY